MSGCVVLYSQGTNGWVDVLCCIVKGPDDGGSNHHSIKAAGPQTASTYKASPAGRSKGSVSPHSPRSHHGDHPALTVLHRRTGCFPLNLYDSLSPLSLTVWFSFLRISSPFVAYSLA